MLNKRVLLYKFVKPTEHMTGPHQQGTVVVPQTELAAVPDEVAIPASLPLPQSVETASEPLYVDLQNAAGRAVTNAIGELKAAMVAEF